MDQEGFRQYLQTRNVNDPAQLEAALVVATRFEDYLARTGEENLAAPTLDFVRMLINEQANSWENLVTLLRYAYFTRQDQVYTAILELLDGAEAQENLYKRVGDRYGEALREQVFEGIGLAALGLPNTQKPATLQPVLLRLQAEFGDEDCIELLADSLRNLPDTYYLEERKLYQESKNIEAFLVQKKANFVAQLEKMMAEGRLFFSQPVTAEVIEYVRQDPEIGGGVCQGAVIYESKIPYMTDAYLAEQDPLRKRYLYCHCPWAREAILSGESVSEHFCNCSAGFHKRNWEVIFGQSLKAKVLESVLRGDARCRFAIYLPPE